MRRLAALVGIALLGCVDASNGTSGATGNTSAASTDPTGSWNALQYTLTSKTDASKTTDLVLTGYKVSMVIATSGSLTITIVEPLQTVSIVGTLKTLGQDVALTAGTDTTATGSFSRTSNQITMDLSGTAFTWDIDHSGTPVPVALHTVMVALAH